MTETRETEDHKTRSQGQPCADAGTHIPRSPLPVEPSAARERPILFSAPMVRALLDGRKTQTPRIVKPQPPKDEDFYGSRFSLDRAVADGVKMYSQNDYGRLPKHPTDWELLGSVGVARNAGFPKRYRCPYGAPGDTLWVRETCKASPGMAPDASDAVEYIADGKRVAIQNSREAADRWLDLFHYDHKRRQPGSDVPSIHMPRWASRITLRVTDVRVERLQDISETDAKAEGVSMSWAELQGRSGTWRQGYEILWEHINGPGSWDANPWVWAVTFEPLAAASPTGQSAERQPEPRDAKENDPNPKANLP